MVLNIIVVLNIFMWTCDMNIMGVNIAEVSILVRSIIMVNCVLMNLPKLCGAEMSHLSEQQRARNHWAKPEWPCLNFRNTLLPGIVQCHFYLLCFCLPPPQWSLAPQQDAQLLLHHFSPLMQHIHSYLLSCSRFITLLWRYVCILHVRLCFSQLAKLDVFHINALKCVCVCVIEHIHLCMCVS